MLKLCFTIFFYFILNTHIKYILAFTYQYILLCGLIALNLYSNLVRSSKQTYAI